MSEYIIGYTGGKRVGKDTAAKYLDCFPFTEKYSLATPIKRALVPITGIPLDEMEDRKEEPLSSLGGKTLRWALQTMGTEWGREIITPEIWLNHAKSKFERSRRPVLLIPDVRFPNEAEYTRRKGTLVHLRRDVDKTDTHSSEQDLKVGKKDLVIENNGTVFELFDELIDVLSTKIPLVGRYING